MQHPLHTTSQLAAPPTQQRHLAIRHSCIRCPRVRRLQALLDGIPDLDTPARALLLPRRGVTADALTQLQARGVQDVLAVWSSDADCDGQDRQPADALGNLPAVRWWQGSLADLPAYQGPVELIVLAAEGDRPQPLRELLLQAALRLKAGAYVAVRPVDLSQEAELAACLPEASRDLPLQHQPGTGVLQVPEAFRLAQAPVLLEGPVVRGFGRGSAAMGTPTANLPPEGLQQQLQGLPLGVYFGWARVDAGSKQPPADSAIHPMVLNIGRRPTVEADAEAAITVEVHIMHAFAAGFYGRHCKALVSGFIRPEVKFSSLDGLISRIRTDVGIARAQLQADVHQQYASHSLVAIS